MNYFAHGRRFVDDPYLLAGTAVPDWLCVSDRRTKVRAAQAQAACTHDDPRLAALARGIVQHHHDDAWFHGTEAFNTLQWQLARQVREVVGTDDSLRPSFLGHILVEILLDATLIAQSPPAIDDYYAAMRQVDPAFVQWGVQQLTPRPVERLALMVEGFCRERFLIDYGDDERLTYRLNQVMRRVGLGELPAAFSGMLPAARAQITAAAEALLAEASTAAAILNP
ncbi:MAG: hypothetical protein JSS27_11960 [Planctomycetes bacterium]|nr:hypothetical protein [Planctomycetota bacterium]